MYRPPVYRPLAHIANNRQRGTVLFISLLLMSALSILGLTAMRNALREEKIAQSTQDFTFATEAAQSALRQGQYQLREGKLGSADSGFSASWPAGAHAPVLNSLEWQSNRPYQLSAAEIEYDLDTFEAKTILPRPKYLVEEVALETLDLGRGLHNIEFIRPLNIRYLRIISRGLGLSGKNEIMLEAMVIEHSR